MAISLTRYVDIVSGVGAGNTVSTRKLVGRFFTTNTLVPTDSYISFDSADDVLSWFGSSSEEYARAAAYFGWISKDIRKAPSIQFARWASSDVPPQIFGAKGTQAVSDWTSITAGAFSLTLNGTTNSFSSLDFSSATSLSDVATVIQTAINAKTGTMWTDAEVAWNSVRQSFDLTGGDLGDADISVTAGGVGNDIADRLGWLSATAIISYGKDAQEIADLLADSANADNNFGSFAFLPTLTETQIVEAALWNHDQNGMFIYSVPCTSANAVSLSAATIDSYSGLGISLSPTSGEYPEQDPMMILAATNYNARNATQNYMFQVFDQTPSVTTNADADIYDALRINYYGRTQTAGQLVDFYQRGYLMGPDTAPLDMGTYANEIWLKDALSAALMTLMLALTKVSANTTGKAQILNTIHSVVAQGIYNGTISKGRTLTNAQKEYIGTQTGDDTAWRKVVSDGYWVDVTFELETVDGSPQYKAVYTLIYAKDDTIRKIEGRDILI